ncbi:MAG TPA: sigma-70 family RNA polymerase sigma factor [Vicinamibacteria bacterium]
MAAPLEAVFAAERGFLWGLAYRLTGNAADADDVVQEAFVRALARPPARTDLPWRPWLVRVTMNLARDALRRRRRHGYPGQWLPSPVPSDEGEPPAFDPPGEAGSPHARYDLVESVSFAFLLALEALTPAQRAVLLLRDVLDYSVKEAARSLRMTEVNVKTTHLRARRAMAGYDRGRPGRSSSAAEKAALERFIQCLAQGDASALEELLAEDVVGLGDGGGVYAASPRPLLGREAVLRLYLGTSRRLAAAVRITPRSLNHRPALVIETPGAPPGWAPRSAMLVQVDASGRITHIYSVLSPAKLGALGLSGE